MCRGTCIKFLFTGGGDMTKQCPSCGGDCGRTAKSGCQYNTPNPKVPKFEVCDTSELSEVLRLTALLGEERTISDALALRVDELNKANAMLVAALDRIHDVLNGVYVDDVALIINRALAANKELRK